MNPQTRPVGYFMGQSLGDCQRCGRTMFTSEINKEWTGFQVCGDCHDPRPPQLSPPNVFAEGVPVPNAAPALGTLFIDTDSPVTPESL